MAIHWQIIFKSLRAGETYTASVYDNTYTGSPVRLYPAASPFTTEEDNDDDPFTAIRSQSGSLRIVDNGTNMAGSAFNWRDLQPRSDYDRPVILKNANGDTVWQGFLQTKNFSGTLYEQVQERDFPLQCPLSVLASQYPSTSQIGIVNFAYLLKSCLDTIKTISGNIIAYDTIHVQGGEDAQRWLMKKFHWANLMTDDDNLGVAAKYDLRQCLEDMCNFWGFQMRTEDTTLYLMCADDASVQTLLTLTEANLSTMASGTVAGTVSQTPFIRKNLTGSVFASADNDDMWMSGPSKVIIGADCNEQSAAFQFAPKSVEDAMEAAGDYTWHHRQTDDPQVGFFATPLISSFDSGTMSGTAGSYAGFCRKQIYSTPEADKPTLIDAFDFVNIQDQNSVKLSIQTKQMMSFSKGSLKFSGQVFKLAEVWDSEANDDFLKVRIGIGETRESAKWWYLEVDSNMSVTKGWSSQVRDTRLIIGNGDIKGPGALFLSSSIPIIFHEVYTFDAIPLDDYMHGYIFVDFEGIIWDGIHSDTRDFTVGNFKVEYSRDEVYIPSNIGEEPRGRQIQTDRQSAFNYTAVNGNAVEGNSNIDLTYASDNNMEYGYGLVMDADYSYMTGARYGDLVLQHPEQHFANRIANFWSTARRLLTVDLRTEQVGTITPRSHLVTAAGAHFRTLAISHNWRDDVTNVKMIQSTIEI